MFYIMRHGKTDWNAKHKLQGGTDIPLNEEGKQMARDAKEEYKDLNFDICYCSPLQRARLTAEIFLENTGVPIVTDDRLREIGFGEFEGIENCFEKPEYSVYKLFKDPLHYVAEGKAESLDSLYHRTGDFIKEVLIPEIEAGKKVLIVGHGAMNCSLINQMKEVPLEDFWRYMTGNCKLQIIE